MRVKAVRLGEDEHVVLFTTHHIVSDGWSMGILVREVSEIYQAVKEGRGWALPELKIQYADYAKWQRQYLTGAVLERHLAYWKKQLSGKLPLLELPADHPRQPVPDYRGEAKSFLLSGELYQSLKGLSRREGVTMFMLLLAAFKTLLYRYTAQEDIILGTAVANRDRAEVESLIGFFINMLPLRTDLSGNPRFTELLNRVKQVALGGYAHQDLPFERMVKEIQPERATADLPLFNVAFGVQNAPGGDLKLPGLEIKPMMIEQERARLDLTLWVTENVESLQLRWAYSKDLFEEETVARMHRHFETLLSDIVGRPGARLSTFEISPRRERLRSPKEQGDRGGTEGGRQIPVGRKGVILPTEPV